MHLHFYPFSWWSVGGHLNIAISRKLTKTFPFVDGYMFVPCYIQSIPILSLLFFHVFPIICVCCTSNIRGSNSETLEGKHGFGRFFSQNFSPPKKNTKFWGFKFSWWVPFWIDPKSGPKSCGASGLPRPRATLTPRPRCEKPFRKPLRTWKIPKGPNFHGGTMGNYGKR